MIYREFGKTGKKISQLGYGAMRLPIINGNDGKIDEAEAIRLIRYAIDGGVNYVDTAKIYHGGTSEKIVGKALKDGYREKTYIATKYPTWQLTKYDDFEKCLNEQLADLQTDYIDFYLIHSLSKRTWDRAKKNNVFKFIKKALADGKIKHIGFSFHDDYEVFAEILNDYDWDFCQIQLNYMDTEYQAGIKGLKLANEKGIGVIVMEPVKGGNLATKQPDVMENIWSKMDFKCDNVEKAFRFIYDLKEVNLVLSGMGSIEMVKQNIDIASRYGVGQVSDGDKLVYEEARKMLNSLTKVPCTGCAYCMPCPHKVDIPENFSYYNTANMFNSGSIIKNDYFKLVAGLAKKCVSCKKCLSACPQHIKIDERMKEVAKYFENV